MDQSTGGKRAIDVSSEVPPSSIIDFKALLFGFRKSLIYSDKTPRDK